MKLSRKVVVQMGNLKLVERLLSFSFLLAVSSMVASGSVPEIEGLYKPDVRVYPYRVDPAEHPDFDLVHYERIHRDTRPGGLDMLKGNFNSHDTSKFNRKPGYNDRNSFDPTDNPESLLDSVRYHRRLYEPEFMGAAPGESDWGFMRWNEHWYTTMGRFEQDRHWLHTGSFFEAFARLYDYQLKGICDVIPASHMVQAGYSTLLGRQNEKHTGLLTLYSGLHRGASRQYGIGIGNTYGYVEHENDTIADYNANAAKGVDHLQTYARGWRWMIESYMKGLHSVRLGGLYFKDEQPPADPLTPLGKMAEQVKTNLTFAYPDPGALHTPIAFMQDFFTGWKHGSMKNNLEGKYTKWETTMPFGEGDHALLNYHSVLYPEYDPRTPENQIILGYLVPDSHTPYGDIADVILSDARPELLSRYNLVVLASELLSDINTLSDKLKHHVRNGGNLMLCAEHAKLLFPEYGLSVSSTVAAGSTLVYAGGETVIEPNPFDLYTASGLPAGTVDIVTYGGSSVMVEIPMGAGFITLSLTPYGMGDEQPSQLPFLPYVILEHVKGVLQAKAEAMRLFEVGGDPDIHYMTTYDAVSGFYTLAVLNKSEVPATFGIQPDNGSSLVNFECINAGDPQEMIAGGLYFWNGEIDYKNPVLSDSEKIANVDAKRAAVGTWTTNYPLNGSGYLSLTNTILGSGVAVFRFQLSDNLDIQYQPKSLYPPRPADWYVHLPIQQLHHRLTRMPDFFNHFGGVKIDGRELLNTSDEILRYEQGWFRVRHFNFLIDARAIPDTGELEELIRKVGYLPYGAKVVMGTTPSSALQDLAIASNAKLAQDSGIAWIDESNLPTSSQVNNVDEIKVLNLYYSFGNDQWERIYGDLRQLTEVCDDPAVTVDPQAAILAGESLTTPLTTATAVAKPAGTRYYLTLLYVDNLPQWIDDHAEILNSKISGINVDSQYVYGRTLDQLRSELNWLRARGLDLVVDISNHVNDFRDFSYTLMPLRSEGNTMLENVMQKIQGLGLSDLIIAPPFEEDWLDPINGTSLALDRLFLEASTYGLNLHLRKAFISHEDPSLGFAAHTVAQNTFYLIDGVYEAPDYDAWTSTRESQFVSVRNKINLASYPLIDPRVALNSQDLHAHDGKILLLDPEYANWAEIAADFAFIGNTPPVLCDQALQVADNASVSTVVATMAVYDGDIATGTPQGLNHVLTGGTGAAFFSVDASTGDVTFDGGTALVAGNSYTLDITVNDLIDPARTSSGVVTLLIKNGINGIPVANGQSVNVTEDVAAIITLGASDPEADTLTYIIVDQPLHGALSGSPGSNSWTYTPDYSFAGSDSFIFKVNDELADSAEVAVTITVQDAANKDPVFYSARILEVPALTFVEYAGSLVSKARAYDPDGDHPLTFSKTTGPAWLQIYPNGVFHGTPSSLDEGLNIFDISVSDGQGGTATATLEIHVAVAPLVETAEFFEDFEDGIFDTFTSAGGAVVKHDNAHSTGFYSASLGTGSSITLTHPFDLTNIEQLKLGFRLTSVAAKTGSSIFVEYSRDNGATWIVVVQLIQGTHFEDRARDDFVFILDDATYNFNSQVKLRMRHDLGSKNIHLDNISISQIPSVSGAYYDTWTTGFALSGADALEFADLDGDGMSNLMEYAFGGNPALWDLPAMLAPSFDTVEVADTKWMEYRYRRRTDASERGLNYYIELTEDLIGGFWSTNGYSETGAELADPGFEVVTNLIPTMGKTNEFMRLTISDSQD